jgi:hypothetical protein
MLTVMKPLTDEHHFCVKEWVRLAFLTLLISNVDLDIAESVPWISSRSENVRRFAIEVIRSRGAWSKHTFGLEESPHHGQILLNGLRVSSIRNLSKRAIQNFETKTILTVNLFITCPMKKSRRNHFYA